MTCDPLSFWVLLIAVSAFVGTVLGSFCTHWILRKYPHLP